MHMNHRKGKRRENNNKGYLYFYNYCNYRENYKREKKIIRKYSVKSQKKKANIYLIDVTMEYKTKPSRHDRCQIAMCEMNSITLEILE